MVIVGIMPAYEEADWIEWAVEGIIDFVDELVITEGYRGPAWHFGGCYSKDGTIDIIKTLAKKYDKITLAETQPRRDFLRGNAATHNHVLKISKRIKEADWYMICDSDEFYTTSQKNSIRNHLAMSRKDFFNVQSRKFFYNFKYYINHILGRFFRVTPGMFFKPAQFAFYEDGRPYYDDTNPPSLLLKDDPMFHYSFVRKPCREIKRRIMEYCAAQRYRYVFDWIDQVFLQWTPQNAREIYHLNQVRFGSSGILYHNAFQQQRLQEYEGNHPAVLDNHPYRHIEDIRKIYRPSKPAHKYISIQHRISHYRLRFCKSVKSIIRKIKVFFVVWRMKIKTNYFKSLKDRWLYRRKCNRFYSKFIKPKGLVYDIGANMGSKSCVFRRMVGRQGRVIAVEPQSRCMQELKTKFSKAKNLKLVQKAVGKTNSTQKMHICNVHALSSLSRDWIKTSRENSRFGQEAKWSQTEEVEVTTLDKLISEYGPPEFVKIDVEGYEKEVISGLSKSIPCFFSLEFVPELPEDIKRCLEHLEQLGRVECNYSLKSSMELAMDDWGSIDEVVDQISDLEKGKDWGDVYVKLGQAL